MGCMSSKRVIYVTPPRPTQSYGGQPPEPERKFENIDEVTTALALDGLETSNLILGIDFTRSNKWTGATSFHGRSLHHSGDEQNPYEQAISVIGRTLSGFHDNNLIPCFGFGDASTLDRDIFSFYPDKRICNGFEEVLKRYKELVPHLKLSGPTSFAPIIEMAITIVEQSDCQYHVLVIIADGPVTGAKGSWDPSPLEEETINAIVNAREYPLTIIVVGVGDGPWDTMKNVLGHPSVRNYKNFQANINRKIMSKDMDISRKEAAFARAALRGIPSQYKATLKRQKLGRPSGQAIVRVPLPPPPTSKHPQPSSFHPSESDFDGHNVPTGTSQPASSMSDDHTCSDCEEDLQLCPICQSTIQNRSELSKFYVT
ncbi:hypothetical protein HYC85_006118 [Camellia sinensis]|uniref:VWFA domain-containing protein n=1 Tax=Camellia sinensis TaxID=4442 RepID=A0A7J7I1E8_CAMSI|nr:hypothetical protein HYC85_006118 [Camellia sinensis]